MVLRLFISYEIFIGISYVSNFGILLKWLSFVIWICFRGFCIIVGIDGVIVFRGLDEFENEFEIIFFVFLVIIIKVKVSCCFYNRWIGMCIWRYFIIWS